MFTLYIGEEQLEMFGTENIELTSQVSSVSDITKNLTDLTKSFTVPASSKNNQIFKHYYNANINNTFDARTKVSGRIELNGMPFRYGKYRLEKVSVKQGKPYAYTLNFWGNGINLKDKLKNDELSALDLTAYDHEYNSDNVKLGLTDSLFGGEIVYSMFAKKQYYYNSDGSDDTLTPTLANIAYNNGGNAGIVWSDLKPSIGLLPIIEAIETKYNLTFSRDFFGREEFTKLYMWLNNSAKSGISGGAKIVEFETGSSEYMDLTTNIGYYPAYRNPSNIFNSISFQNIIKIIPSVGFENVEYKLKTYLKTQITNEFGLRYEDTFTGTKTRSVTISSIPAYVYWEIEVQEAFVYSVELVQIKTVSTDFGFENTTITSYLTEGNDIISGNVVITSNLPKIKIIDFLTGLFKMFKLVIVADDDGLLYVNTINDYYAEGRIHNLTKYINTEEVDIERGKLLNPINFGFQEPTTLLNTQFEANTGQAYGDEELILEDEEGEQLDGESYEVTLPFEQIVYERLIDLVDRENTNIMYGGVFNDTIEGVSPKPHLYYNQNTSLGLKTVSYINDSGVKELISTNLNIPSHTLGFASPQFSTVFGKEVNEWSGEVIQNTLYSNYYSDYITSVFNIKKRVFKYSAENIPLRIRLSLRLNDVIQIQEDFYRIDKFTTNLLTGKTSFELINSFDNTLAGFNADRTIVITDYVAKSESIYVTNGGNFSFNKVDVGYGVSWVTVSNIGSNVYFAFEQNLTGAQRIMEVEITNTLTLQTIIITLIQTDGAGITFDNNVITFDNTNITFDNSI